MFPSELFEDRKGTIIKQYCAKYYNFCITAKRKVVLVKKESVADAIRRIGNEEVLLLKISSIDY
jgi:hypothetical protein